MTEASTFLTLEFVLSRHKYLSLLKHPEALKLKNRKDIEHVITIALSCIISLLSMTSITHKSDEESKRNTLTHLYTPNPSTR